MVGTLPIGKINYLHSDGTIGYSKEFTSEQKFREVLEEETFYGVPVTVTLFENAMGETIPHAFIYELDPPPKGLVVVPY